MLPRPSPAPSPFSVAARGGDYGADATAAPPATSATPSTPSTPAPTEPWPTPRRRQLQAPPTPPRPSRPWTTFAPADLTVTSDDGHLDQPR